MSEPMGAAVPALGARIRSERLRRGVTVRGLARDIGVSASLISQIETEKSHPSVSTLYAITSALGLPVEELFMAESPPERDAVGDDGRMRLVGRDRTRSVGPLVEPERRERLTLDSGVTWERLGQLPGAHIDFLLITYEPGGTSSSSGELMRHDGTEYGYLVSGELVLTLGFEEHRLTAGDSVCFDSTTPHRFRNDRDVPAVGVWFVLERG